MRPKLFVELCCGSAAVTLKLLGGRYAVPPISYMGSKRGYAHAILWAMGLRQGQGADRVLLCDASAWGHVWGVLADRDRCLEVASIIRGWKDEDPRQLWERLREEHRGEWDGWTAQTTEWQATRLESVAAWLQCGSWSYRDGMPESGFYAGNAYTREFKALNGDVGTIPPRSCKGQSTRLESVAAWLQVSGASWKGNGKHYRDCATSHGGDLPITPEGIAARITPPTAPITVYPGSAADIDPPDDCDGVFMFCDPPYVGTTGYSCDLPREDVLAIARKWSDAGAVVCISEAEPLDLDGWHHLDIASTRVGQRRTFSKCQTEWITLNREPAWRPQIQTELFG